MKTLKTEAIRAFKDAKALNQRHKDLKPISTFKKSFKQCLCSQYRFKYYIYKQSKI